MKFICTHTVPPNTIGLERYRLLALAAQTDPQVRGYRSFSNLTEGKIVCIMEGPDRDTVQAWFQRQGVPVDMVIPLEYEGDRGEVVEEHVYVVS